MPSLFYFSATGNSRHTAHALGEMLGFDATDIRKATAIGAMAHLIVVTPVFYWRLPLRTEAFLRTNAPLAERISVVFTSGGSIGSADHYVRSRIKHDHLVVHHHPMVTNYIVLHALPDDARIADRHNAADVRLPRLAANLLNHTGGYTSPALLRPFGCLFGLLFRLARRTRLFRVSGACDGCAVCVRVCPDHAIRLKDGRPVWQRDRCQHCLACLHRCPRAAIDYGKRTAGKARYLYPSAKGTPSSRIE